MPSRKRPAATTTLLAVKAVQQNYTPNSQLLGLLEQFRQMVNNSIRIGLAENFTSLNSLSLKPYRQLEQHDAMSYYKLCAISKAAGILKNYRKSKRTGPKLSRAHEQLEFRGTPKAG